MAAPLHIGTISLYAEPRIIERGERYYADGAVFSLIRRGHVIDAEVAGSDVEPYRVQVWLDGEDLDGATCTCPYDWGGWCKHIVAVLLTLLHDPEVLDERPPLAETLGRLTKDRLVELIEALVRDHPALIDDVEERARSGRKL